MSKKILLIVSSLLLLMNIYSVSAEKLWSEKENFSKQISEINNGAKYKKIIDSVLNLRKDNIWYIETLIERTDIIVWKYISKDLDQKNTELLIVVQYIRGRAYGLKNTYEEKIWEEEWQKEKNLEILEQEKQDALDEKEKQEVIFPWFSDDYSDKPKTILAWVETFVYNGSLVASIEEIEVEELEFILETSDTSNIKQSIKSAWFYYRGLLLSSSNSSDITIISGTKAKITFSNIDDLIIPKKQQEFRLSITPELFGYEKIWKFVAEITVTSVYITKASWVTSGWNIIGITLQNNQELFQIAPAVLEVSILKNLQDHFIAEINIKADFNKNSADNNSELKASIQKIQFLYQDNGVATEFRLYNSGDSLDYVVGTKNASILEFNLSWFQNNIVSEWRGEDYRIRVMSNQDTTVSLNLIQTGVSYDVMWLENVNNLNINMKQSISLGSRKY